jgi:hypothetical protein
MKTTDNFSYYKRHQPIKVKFIEDFIKNKTDINNIFDVGCNNGDISYFFQKKYNKNVLGVDLSKNLELPDDYDFKNIDIVNDNLTYFNDVTFFLSLYHHLLGAYSLEIADSVFYKLLFRTKYLIFDCGNLSEKNRTNTYWYKKQKEYFNNEKELFDHFNIKYDILDSWNTGGGSRSVVVFYSSDLNNKLNIINEYKRYIGSKKQVYGLINICDINSTNNEDIFHENIFYKLEFNGKYFFSKKHFSCEKEKNELNNIIDVYNTIDKNKLINFYGHIKKYGFVYEWLDNIKYNRKWKLILNDKILNDVDIITVNNKEKIIDFER